VKNKTDQLRK